MDNRSEWTEVTTWGAPSQWIRGACHHRDPVPVTTCDPLEPVLVARLCTDCGEQLPVPEWNTSAPVPRPHTAVPVRPPVWDRALFCMRAAWGYTVAVSPIITLSIVLMCFSIVLVAIGNNLGIW